ncbi:hypothetical protein PsYK624_114120 [Phanerochaete sordida]|uniref:Uncharacterized protein n=1 Tax=Phanerochaete sordida TaxID=48140 RepID=A0A9P3LHE2_9APHY|nr:hypothetical protein PsYK624_114120 [Phanerochaete sordida]
MVYRRRQCRAEEAETPAGCNKRNGVRWARPAVEFIVIHGRRYFESLISISQSISIDCAGKRVALLKVFVLTLRKAIPDRQHVTGDSPLIY